MEIKSIVVGSFNSKLVRARSFASLISSSFMFKTDPSKHFEWVRRKDCADVVSMLSFCLRCIFNVAKKRLSIVKRELSFFRFILAQFCKICGNLKGKSKIPMRRYCRLERCSENKNFLSEVEQGQFWKCFCCRPS